MNRLFIALASLGMLLVAVAASQAAQAQAALSETHIERIRQNCVTAQTALSQIHASDALLRVNRGSLYENISDKLMAPLNSRIALSRLEGLRMASIALEYDRRLDAFRVNYKQYEETMSRTLKINCAEKPVEFYESVTQTRQERRRLHENTRTITALLLDYKTGFEDFAKRFEEREG